MLRDYQKEAVISVVNSTERSVGIALATGLGKTRIAVSLAEHYRRLGNKVLFVVPSCELMRQAALAFGTTNMLGDGEVPDPLSTLTIAIVNSVDSGKIDINAYRVLIVDECHHATSARYSILVQMPHWLKIINLSATMFRADGLRLGAVVDKVVFERNLQWGIQNKYLTGYKLLRPSCAARLPVTTERAISRKEDGSEKEIERKTYDHSERNILVRDLVREVVSQHSLKHGIMFCNTVAHAKKMSEIMPGWGWCSGEYKDDLEKYKRGELQGICSVQLLLEGFDYPPTDFLVVNGNIRADSTGAIRWIQLLGRILRLSPGKEVAVALDLSINGCPDVDYLSDLGGLDYDEEMQEEGEEEATLTVIERLEHPCLLDLDTLLAGMRCMNGEFAMIKKELRTNLNLVRGKDGFAVAGSDWRIVAKDGEWKATDGRQTISGNSVSALETQINATVRGNLQGPASERQKKLLTKWGVPHETVKRLTCQQASDYIDTRLAQKNTEPATEKQLKFLKWKMRGKVPESLSKDQAKRLIAGFTINRR